MTEPTPASDPVLDVTFRNAQLGDVLQDDEGRPVPDGWHLMDGSTLISYEWPDFVGAMGIAGGQFTLPAPERMAPGRQWLIKLGERRPISREVAHPGGQEGPTPNARMFPPAMQAAIEKARQERNAR